MTLACSSRTHLSSQQQVRLCAVRAAPAMHAGHLHAAHRICRACCICKTGAAALCWLCYGSARRGRWRVLCCACCALNKLSCARRAEHAAALHAQRGVVEYRLCQGVLTAILGASREEKGGLQLTLLANGAQLGLQSERPVKTG